MQQEEQETRPPFPPLDEETARQKVKAAEDAWNTRDPQKVSLALAILCVVTAPVGSRALPRGKRTDNAPKVRFSATLGEEPEVEVGLV